VHGVIRAGKEVVEFMKMITRRISRERVNIFLKNSKKFITFKDF